MQDVLPGILGLLGALVAVLVVIFMSRLFSKWSGWSELARNFQTASQEPEGMQFRWCSLRMGIVAYNSIVRIVIADKGLFLKLEDWGRKLLPTFRYGHPALFIPWRQLAMTVERKYRWHRIHKFSLWFGPPHIRATVGSAHLALPIKLLSAIQGKTGLLKDAD
jgi:hypothetical protein